MHSQPFDVAHADRLLQHQAITTMKKALLGPAPQVLLLSSQPVDCFCQQPLLLHLQADHHRRVIQMIGCPRSVNVVI
jgi:hypothetical protein